jgi:hypothetical protein
VFTKKENATLQQCIEILYWFHQNGKNQSSTAKHFAPLYPNLCIKQPLILAWVKEESKWRAEYQSHVGSAAKVKHMQQIQHPEVSEMLDLWAEQAMARDVMLTGEVLRQKWTQFADLVDVPEDEHLNLSDGWLARFKMWNGMHEYKCHGKAASADPAVMEEEKDHIRNILKKHEYATKDIFNMDETGLFYAYAIPKSGCSYLNLTICSFAPDRGLLNKKTSSVKGNKVRLTYAFTANADGSEKLEPFVIGKAKQPRCFLRRLAWDLGFLYRNNAKVWMTTILYQEWITRWDDELRARDCYVLLLQDNFSAHVPPNTLTNICVVNFSPNLTAHVQPLDAGIIRCFKAHYRSRYMQAAIDNYDTGVSPAHIYDIDQLDGMRKAASAWDDVSASTIANCWRKVGILLEHAPDDPATPAIPVVDPVRQAEIALETTLDELENRGVLQASNRLSIESLVNPDSEKDIIDDSMEQDIYNAVVASRDAQQMGEINGGDDDVEDNMGFQPRPTCREALSAAQTL